MAESEAAAVEWAAEGWERLGARVGRCRLPGWDCTCGLVAGHGAALMVDAGSTLREGARLRGEAERLLGAGGRVTSLALTHPHFDHVLGAPAVAGAEVYAAAGADALVAGGAEGLRADAVRHGVAARDAAEASEAVATLAGAAWHPVRAGATTTLDLGGGVRVVLANVGPGHTAHDLAVLVPGGAGGADVVFCGDLVEESGEPQAGPDAVPERWPAALDRLLALGGPGALYVPGHGAVVDADFVRRQGVPPTPSR